ncbi:MAG TPA: type II toxin-antitoxin system VapC family toxin [Thermodesulfovibrionia bacterium]|nr:type II toxin-antitoxin system VapC family toxin [Thermodesulfovibrionia bacterium]
MTVYIFDSDHLSLHQRGHESLKYRLLSVKPEQICITIISVEELLRGRLAQIHKAKEAEDRIRSYYWLSKTIDYLNSFTIVNYDLPAETHFQMLRKLKIRIGVQDMKIAAISLSQNAVLITRNKQDFGRVPSLRIEDWSA